MKILMLGWEYPPLISGGLATATEGLVNGLVNLGHHVTLVLPHYPHRLSRPNFEIVSPENPFGPALARQLVARDAPRESDEDLDAWARRELDEGQGENIQFSEGVFTALTRTLVERIHRAGRAGPDSLGTSQRAQREGGASAVAVEPGALVSPYYSGHVETLELSSEQKKIIAERLDAFQRRIVLDRAGAVHAPLPAGEIHDNIIVPAEPIVHSAAEQTYLLGLLALSVLRADTSFDVVHAHDWMSFIALDIIKKNSHLPVVAHVHSTEYDRGGSHGNQNILAMEHYGVQRADRVITVSELTKSILVRQYAVPRDKIDVVYNASNEQHDSRDLTARPTPATASQDPERLPVVCFVGRITHQKGPAYFVQAAHRALQINPRILFRVVGSGDLLPSMKQLVWELGIERSFRFEGFLTPAGVQRYLAESDIFVMPSVSEPFGIVALEAIAQNIPVIISKQSGVSEVLSHALKVDFWDTELMADRILSLIKRPALVKTLSHNARHDLGYCNWTRSAHQCTIAYTKALQ